MPGLFYAPAKLRSRHKKQFQKVSKKAGLVYTKTMRLIVILAIERFVHVAR